MLADNLQEDDLIGDIQFSEDYDSEDDKADEDEDADDKPAPKKKKPVPAPAAAGDKKKKKKAPKSKKEFKDDKVKIQEEIPKKADDKAPAKKEADDKKKPAPALKPAEDKEKVSMYKSISSAIVKPHIKNAVKHSLARKERAKKRR
jgi:hypothetical protein